MNTELIRSKHMQIREQGTNCIYSRAKPKREHRLTDNRRRSSRIMFKVIWHVEEGGKAAAEAQVGSSQPGG